MFNLKILIKYFNNFFSLIFLTNIILLNFTNQAIAEKTRVDSKKNNSNYGLPTHRRDGGSRGGEDNCVSTNEHSLVALIPQHSIGINTSKSPQLFFYVPQIKEPKILEFVLRDEQDKLIYEAFIATEGEGIMDVTIPADINANLLKIEQNYHWYLSIICNPQQRSRDLVVEGWLRREEMDLASRKLNSASVVEQAEMYRKQGFWYDALAILAANLNTQAEQPMIRAKWSELLQSVGLGEVAFEPFIESKIIE